MDLDSVEVLRFHGKKVTSTTKATQVVMPISLRKKLQGAAPARGCSMNELLNSAVLAWLTKGRSRGALGTRRTTYDAMNGIERKRLWESLVSLTGLEPGPHSPSREGGHFEWDKRTKAVLEVVPSGKRFVVDARGGDLVRVREIGRSHFVERPRVEG